MAYSKFDLDNKNVVVTGGASFIGSHLVEKLVDKHQCKITILDDFSSGKRSNIQNSGNENYEIIECDLRDWSSAKYIKGSDVVFHLANIHGGRGFIESHPADITQNFAIDSNIFRACQEYAVERVVYTSSACAYPTSLQTVEGKSKYRFLSEGMADPFKESCALADGEYGWAKFMGEMALRAYGNQYGMKGVSCRLFTVYGPRENESHAIIAFLAKALIKQDPFEIWGSGEQDRNFTFVDDVVDGLILSAMHISDCRAINIGTDEITKIKDAAQIACKLANHEPQKFYFDRSKPEGVHARAACIDNQIKWLGWKPTVSFEDGLRKTYEWYKENFDAQNFVNNLEAKLFER